MLGLPWSFWIPYFVFVGWLLISGWIIKRRANREWEFEKGYAKCRCGQRMSEWFVKDGYMWHPEFVRGCGWVSPWTDHEDYRNCA